MGDLVLTYPLCGWLYSALPHTPVWVVGERLFFEGMLDISPALTFFDYSSSSMLKNRKYSLIINLSHRREAAVLAGSLQCEQRIGPYVLPENQDGETYIEGAWQLYRTSITQNNRHNLFHWADLNALDLITLSQMQRTCWPVPVPSGQTPEKNRVGLFIGASTPDKHPGTDFWVSLTDRFLRCGIKPVLLGGKNDKAQADSIASALNIHALNLCGHFSISELCMFMRKLDLLIVPDTGPMHIAAWIGLPVLNLSVGSVNAWETAPFAPNHHVIRPALSCAGCWLCNKAEILCKKILSPGIVAEVAGIILENRHETLSKLYLKGHQLFRTARDEYGLFTMQALGRYAKNDCPRLDRSLFWKTFFLIALKKIPQDEKNLQKLHALAQKLNYPDHHNKLGRTLLEQGQKLLLVCSRALRFKTFSELSPATFWQSYPPILRPLSSYVQLLTQNANFSIEAMQQSVDMLEFFISHMEKQG
jgi:ADP-heptose:LPS heptosyltransferase